MRSTMLAALRQICRMTHLHEANADNQGDVQIVAMGPFDRKDGV